MSVPSFDPNAWGTDPLSREIASQIQGMADRPRVVIALINGTDENDAKVIRAMLPHRFAFARVTRVEVVQTAYRVYYFGFDQNTAVTAAEFLAGLGALPFIEGVVYVDGAPAIRLSKLSGKEDV